MALLWAPFAIFPSDANVGRTAPTLVELAGPPDADGNAVAVCEWSVDSALKNFAVQAMFWYQRARAHGRGGLAQPRVSVDDLRAWIASTKSLADRLPFPANVGERMRHAASAVEQALAWPARYFQSGVWQTGIDTMADADRRASLNIWAADRLFRAVKRSELEHASQTGAVSTFELSHAKLWATLFEGPEDSPPFANYNEAQKRAKNLDGTIKPEQREALMVELLREVLWHGPYRDEPVANE